VQGGEEVTRPALNLHTKLYRAKAIDIAIEALIGDDPNITISRKRSGQYHLMELSGLEAKAARETLAEIADAALIATVELDR
jgi:hypothetical protein